MTSTYCANDTSFNFQTSGDFGGAWDETFDISPIDAGSFTTGSSSYDEASGDRADPAALSLPMDAAIDIDWPSLDNFDFTYSEVPISEAILSPSKSNVSCGETAGCPISQAEHQSAKPQDLLRFNFSNTAGCQLEVEDCVPPCHAPIPTSPKLTLKRKSESASSSSKISSHRNASPPSAKVRKQSTDIEGSPHETHGPRGSKTAHSIIERKYRENLNSKMAQLQQTLSVTDYFAQGDVRPSDESAALNVAKPRKGDVLARTIDYIQHAEIDKRHMSEEIRLLRSEIAAMRRVNNCGDCSLVNQLRALQLQVPVKV